MIKLDIAYGDTLVASGCIYEGTEFIVAATTARKLESVLRSVFPGIEVDRNAFRKIRAERADAGAVPRRGSDVGTSPLLGLSGSEGK